jgi:hypothetical protein
VPNRATERANHAKGAISEIAESISCVFSIGGNSSTPPASTINIENKSFIVKLKTLSEKLSSVKSQQI